MKKYVLIVSLAVFFCACSASKKTVLNSSETTTTGIASAADGFSYKTAIIIKAKNETTGIAKEYEWLKANYPGYSLIKQSLKENSKKMYDVMQIKTVDGTEKEIYFDINSFYGKF